MVGNIGQTKGSDADCMQITSSVKAQFEGKLGRSPTLFIPVSYAKQTVAGVNYFVKVQIEPTEYAHLRIFKGLKGEIQLHSFQDHKSSIDPIVYF